MAAEYVVHNNDFSRYDEDPRMILVKVDRNNTHYYTDTRCPKCGGTGYIPGYEHVEGGVCFMCGGSGRGSRSVIVRTYEYNQKLVNAWLEKARKTAGERNAKYLQSRGFSVEGFAWIVMGKTFEIKDLQEKWEADHAPKTEWYGSIKDKVDLNVKLIRRCSYDTMYGTTYVYTFEDDQGHQLVWKTGTWLEQDKGDEVTLKGTIKAHSEYKGIKQTELTRCKVI